MTREEIRKQIGLLEDEITICRNILAMEISKTDPGTRIECNATIIADRLQLIDLQEKLKEVGNEIK